MKNVHEVSITIEGTDWSTILDSTFKKKSKDVKVDGFRKGAVPKDVYIKKFGMESLYMDAVDTAVGTAYKKALNESNLVPVIEPAVDITSIDEKAVIFKFTVITKPEIKLGEYKNLKVKREEIKVSKEEIDSEINHLQSQLAENIIKDDGEVESGDTAVIDFEGTVDGKKLDGGSGTDYPLEIGSNTFIPGFEEKLIGMKKDESKTIDLTFPENYTPELANKDVTFKVTIKSIKQKVLPELSEDFYKDLGHEDIKDEKSFRAEIEANLKKSKEAGVEDAYIESCLSKAADNMKVELNPEIISEEVHRMIHQYEEQLKMQGLNMEQYLEFTKQTHDDLHKMMEGEATKRVKYRYLIEAVADKENIEVSDEDANTEAENSSKVYAVSKEEFLSMIGGIEMMKYDLRMRKAIDIIKG